MGISPALWQLAWILTAHPPFPSSIVNSYGRMYRAFEFQMFKDIPHNSMAAKHHVRQLGE